MMWLRCVVADWLIVAIAANVIVMLGNVVPWTQGGQLGSHPVLGMLCLVNAVILIVCSITLRTP